METTTTVVRRVPWNKGKLVGQNAPIKVKDIWAIRVRLQIQVRTRDLTLFNLGIDSKLRGCDLVKLRVRDVCNGDSAAARAIVLQQKTQRPVQFEITPSTREAVEAWIKSAALRATTTYSPADCMRHHTLARGSTLVLWTVGSGRPALIRRRYLATIRNLLRTARDEWQWIEVIPKIRLPSAENERDRWLTHEEADRLIEAAASHLQALIRFALATGCRAREITGLEWSRFET